MHFLQAPQQRHGGGFFGLVTGQIGYGLRVAVVAEAGKALWHFGQAKFGVVRLQDITTERVVGVQDQGGARLRRMEDAAAHGRDRQAAAGGDLLVAQAGDGLQQGAFAHAGAPADADVEGVAHQAAFEHAQTGERGQDRFLHGAKVQTGKVEAGLAGRFVVLAQLAHGGLQRLQLALQVVPAGNFLFDDGQFLAPVLQDGVDPGVDVGLRGGVGSHAGWLLFRHG